MYPVVFFCFLLVILFFLSHLPSFFSVLILPVLLKYWEPLKTRPPWLKPPKFQETCEIRTRITAYLLARATGSLRCCTVTGFSSVKQQGIFAFTTSWRIVLSALCNTKTDLGFIYRFAGWWGHDRKSRFEMGHGNYYSELPLRRTLSGPALCVRLREVSSLEGVLLQRMQ